MCVLLYSKISVHQLKEVSLNDLFVVNDESAHTFFVCLNSQSVLSL